MFPDSVDRQAAFGTHQTSFPPTPFMIQPLSEFRSGQRRKTVKKARGALAGVTQVSWSLVLCTERLRI